jgi:DNA-binding protein HU-beta
MHRDPSSRSVTYHPVSRKSTRRKGFMALTQSQLIAEVADRAEVTRADAKAVLAALEEVVLEELGNAEKVKIGGLVQLAVRVRPATKARKGRNPATGEEITISAKPAAVALKARPLARAKSALPSVQKAKRRLAA